MGNVSWEDLEGGAEASHHRGEVYRQVVENYLNAAEYMSIDDPYSGVSDIRLVRPALNEEKIFRVETKNTKARLGNKSFVNEVARHLLDYCFGDEEFELIVFAPEYADSRRWRSIFEGRVRKEEEVQRYFGEIQEKHNLNDEEAEKFEEVAYDDFRQFVEIVALKKVTSGRLEELTRDRASKGRDEKKWEYFVKEFKPVQDQSSILPNFFEVVDYPDSVWTFQSRIGGSKKVYEEVPRYYPIWVDKFDVFSLIGPDELPEDLEAILDTNSVAEQSFEQWAFKEERVPENIITNLLSLQLIWRGVRLHDRCVPVPHQGRFKLIFTTEKDRYVQETLSGEIIDPDDAQTEKVEGYTITRDLGRGIGHRYGYPQIKWYGGIAFAFISTGWLFTKNGQGDFVVEGDAATQLHHSLGKNNYDKIPNRRAQFRQWRQYLRMGSGDSETLKGEELTRIKEGQRMKFCRPDGLELPVRPPATPDEQEAVRAGEEQW